MGHEVGVGDRDAEAEGTHLFGSDDLVTQRPKDEVYAVSVSGEYVAQLIRIVRAPTPGDRREIGAITDAEVVEGA